MNHHCARYQTMCETVEMNSTEQRKQWRERLQMACLASDLFPVKYSIQEGRRQSENFYIHIVRGELDKKQESNFGSLILLYRL
jgi:dsRNA-specific ribonuclease